MKNLLAASIVSVIALAPLGALAHQGHAHKMIGTVTAVHAEMKHVEMKTTDGKAAAFYVNDATKYLKDKSPASLADLKPGTRVVVTARQDSEKKMIASEVQLGARVKAETPSKHQ